MIESIERRTLSLRDPPRVADPSEEPAAPEDVPGPPPPEPSPTPRPAVDRPSDVLASMKTIKMPPRRAPSDDDDPDRPTLEQDRPTLPTRIHPIRTTDVMPPEPSEPPPPAETSSPSDAFSRIQVPSQAEHGAAFAKLMETPSDTPPPMVAEPPRRIPWLALAAILLAIAVVLVILLFGEIGRS
jgi:hypothetical protein